MAGDEDQRALIAQLTAALAAQAEQGRQLQLMLAGQQEVLGRLVAGAAPAKAASPVTLRKLYEMNEATWGDETWAPQMRSTLAPALRHFADRPAESITRAEWIYWRDHVRAKERTQRKDGDGNNTPPSPYTRNLEFKRWRSVYRWGMGEGHVAVNPLLDVKPARGAKKHRHTRPSDEDVIKLLVICVPELRAFVIVGARTGMRASEVRRLEWRQVDLERGRIRIYWHVAKTRKERWVPLTSDAVAALRAIKPDVPGRYVFQSERTGKPVVASTLWRKFRTAADAAGLEAAEGDGKVVYHDLRHVFAGWGAEHLPLPVVAAIGGWADLRTMSRYIQVSDAQIIAAQGELERAIRRGPQRADEPPVLSTISDSVKK